MSLDTSAKTCYRNGTVPMELNPESALSELKQAAGEIIDIRRRELDAKMHLGDLLLAIQAKEIFRQMPGACKNWTDWLIDEAHGFPAITGLRKRSAEEAMDMASSKVLKEMSPQDRREIRSISIAKTLVVMEKAGVKIRPEHIANSKIMSSNQFKQSVGASVGAVVRVWVRDEMAVPHLQAIAEYLAKLSSSGAQKLRETFDILWKLEAAGCEDAVDTLAALVQHEIDRQVVPIKDRRTA